MATRACAVFQFLDRRIAVRSSSARVLDHVRLIYRRFHVADHADCRDHAADRTLEIEESAGGSELLLDDGRCSYRLVDLGGVAQFTRHPGGALEPDLVGSCDPLTLVQAALLDTVAASAGDTHRLFHAGAVSVDGRAVLFPATSGAGKTTLVLKLLERGARLLSDEVGCIDLDTGLVVPFPRLVNVREASTRLLGIPATAMLRSRRTGRGEQEWTVDVEDIGGAHEKDPRPPGALVFLQGIGRDPIFEMLPKARALFDLVPFSIGPLEDAGELLTRLAPIVDAMRCYRLVAGDLDRTADALLATLDGAD